MARDNDDIFRKLKKETPIIKRKDLQPLASRDFSRKSALDITIEKQTEKKRVSPKPASSGDLDAFSRSSAKPRPVRREAEPPGRAGQTRREQSKPAARVQPRHDLDIFGETKPPARTPNHADRTHAPIRQHEKDVRDDAMARPGKQADAGRAQSRLQVSLNNIEVNRPQKELHVFPGSAKSVRGLHMSDAETRLIEPDETSLMEEHGSDQLTFRHELKYFIDFRDYVLLRSTLKALLPLDRFAGADGDYHIRSLYFDDVYETALKDKVSGSDMRNKYRIRIYNISDDTIKFEKKHKIGQYIAKESIRIGRDECENLIAGDYSVLEHRKEPLASEIYLQMKNNCLRPRVIVDYLREAYVSTIENVRITFDKNLKAGLWMTDIFNPNAPTMPLFDNGMMVLEVKFNRHLPPHIKGVLNCVNAAQRCAISKYVLCRWHD